MQTYNEIISKLTESQKVRILTDFKGFTEHELSAMGLPHIGASRVSSCQSFPPPSHMARSWNTELITEVSDAACRELYASGSTQVFLPGARAGIGERYTSLSEEPILSGDVSGAYLAGANKADVAAILEGYGVESSKSTKYPSDEEMDVKEFYKHLTKPFEKSLSMGKCLGVIAEDGQKVDVRIKKTGTQRIRRKITEEQTVKSINRGEVFFSGSAEALQSALDTYRILTAKIENGKGSVFELEDAVSRGEAMSEKSLDKAVKRMLSYILAGSDRQEETLSEQDTGVLRVHAFAAASVLLKNEKNILPLTNPKKHDPKKEKPKVCIIGDIATKKGNRLTDVERIFTDAGFTYSGYARGYDLRTDRSEELLEDAEQLAWASDVAIVFLSNDVSHIKDRLPANQIALCDALGRTGTKVITVISSEDSPEIEFLSRIDTHPKAVLLCPLAIKNGVEYVLRMLFGEYAPEGRLSKTIASTSSSVSDRDTFLIGPFKGYRYYDTVGYGTVYPFGHGLTYTKFAYSGLSVSGNKVTFTVKNIGDRAGVEVAQVYLGIKNSKILRPKKELSAYARIELAPKEKRTVTLDIKDISVYDPESDEELIENGTYTVYVGASVSDIKLKSSFKRLGGALKSDGRSASDYLPSVTNIFKEHYTLEAEYTPMKSSVRNLIVGICAIVLAVAVKVYDIVTMSGSIFLNVVAALLAIGSIVFFILEMYDRKKQFKANREAMEEASREMFSDADTISVPSANELFKIVKEKEAQANAAASVQVNGESEYDYFGDVDKELNFGLAAEELSTFAHEKGVTLDKDTALEILAAFASSRLVVTKDMSDEKFEALQKLLCEYFGSIYGVDTVDEKYTCESDVMFAGNATAERPARHALSIVRAARNKIHNIHIVALTNVELSGMPEYFSSYARFVRSPYSANRLTLKDDNKKSIAFRIPENVWFMLNLKEGESLGSAPDYVYDLATINTWNVEIVANESETVSEYHLFRYGQMLYLCERAKSVFVLDESVFKKIDRLESYAVRYGDFKLGNKMWIGLETYLSVLIAADTDEAIAIDKGLAVKFIPSVIKAVSGKLSRDDRGLGETLDVIFGDEHTSACRKVIKTSGTDII